MKTAGVVFDFYDDPTGRILREIHPDPKDLPETVKEAHILSPEERDVLRNEAFALVMQNEGKVLRKFACVDRGNTYLSMKYFEKTAHLLPEEVRTVVRKRLMDAADRYAEPEKTAAKKDEPKRATGMSKTRDSLQQPVVGDDADWAQRTNLVSIRGGADSGRVIPAANTMKTASIKTMPTHFEVTVPGTEATGEVHAAAMFLIGKGPNPVDVSGKEPETTFVEKKASRHALRGEYPLDSYADVRAAVEYFHDNWPNFQPPDRHEFAKNAAARAQEIGLDIGMMMERYGSTGYSHDIDAFLAQRQRIVEPQYKEVYEALREKRAEIDPEHFAALLAKADTVSGLNWHWGGEVADPWYATFGGGTEKTAFAWESDGKAVSAEDLQELAGNKALEGVFEKDIVQAFNKDPVAIFSSLPDDSKRIIADLI